MMNMIKNYYILEDILQKKINENFQDLKFKRLIFLFSIICIIKIINKFFKSENIVDRQTKLSK